MVKIKISTQQYITNTQRERSHKLNLNGLGIAHIAQYTKQRINKPLQTK